MAATRGKMVDIRIGGTDGRPILRVGFIINVNSDGTADIACPDFLKTGDRFIKESVRDTDMQEAAVRVATRRTEGVALNQWREIV